MGNTYSARRPTKTRTTNHSHPAAVSCISLGCLSVRSSIDGSSQDTNCLVEKQNVIVREKDQLFPFAYTPNPPTVLDKLEYENFLRQYPGLSQSLPVGNKLISSRVRANMDFGYPPPN